MSDTKSSFSKQPHLICSKCGILLVCEWMGISLDFNDECEKGDYHISKEVICNCEEKCFA